MATLDDLINRLDALLSLVLPLLNRQKKVTDEERIFEKAELEKLVTKYGQEKIDEWLSKE